MFIASRTPDADRMQPGSATRLRTTRHDAIIHY